MNQTEDIVQSPCIENCCLNGDNVCMGCFRSLGEIAQWQQMDDKMRQVLHKAESRRKSSEVKGDRDV
jgi:predicted Fe-S protein YdhL (DUF1289 family)